MSRKHNEPGKVRLPEEIAEQWDIGGYGTATSAQMYDVLWWLADMGYSIVPDSEVNR